MKRTALVLTGVALMGASLGFSPLLGEAASPVLKSGSHCVAWKTNKTLALVKRATAVGTSCNVTVKAVKSGANLGAEISVPIASFSSGEKDRDKEVLKILEASKQPSLVFKVNPLSPAAWQAMLKNGSGPVKGNLFFGNRAHPLTAIAKVKKNGSNIEVYGDIVTKFSTLGIKPPVVGPGGSIAKVDDYLELHFNFVSSKVQNTSVVPGL